MNKKLLFTQKPNFFVWFFDNLQNLANWILDFIFPQFCLGCKKEGSLCCQECLHKIPYQTIAKNPWDNYCHLHFSACYICTSYQNKLIQKLIHNYKYNYIKNISTLLVEILYKQIAKVNLPTNTIITNIPLHPSKKRSRGFDQTYILATQLSKKLNIQYLPLLKRSKKTKSQASLDKKDRIKNLKDAFEINCDISIDKNKTVLLLDDVCTTGFTLSEAAKTLKEKGYNNIICLAIAKN